MLKEKEIKELLKKVNNREGEFKSYNDIFNIGYKMALMRVLEIKMPKATPSEVL